MKGWLILFHRLEIVNYPILHSSDRHISIPGKYRSVHLYFAGQLPLPPSLPPPQPIPQDYTDIIPSLQVDRADPRACFAHIDHQKLLPLCLSRCRGDNMNPERFAVAEHHNCSFPANLRVSKRFEGFAKERRSRRSLIRWKNRLNFRELLILFIAEVTFKKGEIGC